MKRMLVPVVIILAILGLRSHVLGAYSNLTLIQEIDTSITPGNNYESGGIIQVQNILGEDARVATGDQSWFGYKIGSDLDFNRPYVIEVVYPEDTPRAYMMALMDCGGWQPGSHYAFHTGVYECEDNRFYWPENITSYPLRQEYKSYWIIAWPQEHWNTQGKFLQFPNTHGTWDTGLWLYFVNKYDDTNNSGLAVSKIRLYEVPDVDDLVDPEVDQLRLQSSRRTFWTLESDSRSTWETHMAKARIAGANTLVPVFMAWNFKNGEYAYYRSHFEAWLRDILPAAKEQHMDIIPKLEYGGSPSLPSDAWAVTPNNVGYDQELTKVGGHGTGLTKAVNVRKESVREDLEHLIDVIYEEAGDDSDLIAGIMIRNRTGNLAPSFSDEDITAYESETGNTIAGSTYDDKRATLKTELPWQNNWSQWGTAVHIGNGHNHPYMQWYYQNLADFLQDIDDYIKTNYGSDKVLLYHPFSAEGIFSQMTVDPAQFLAGQEWGYQPGMFSGNTFHAFVPADQYWNAGSSAYLGALSSLSGANILVDPMYVEYSWSWFPYTQLAPSFEHGGQEYSNRSELLAVANSNPQMLGKSDFSVIHRGFPVSWNAFIKQFYLIPDEEGTVTEYSADVTLKSFSSGRVLVINKSLLPQSVDLSASYSTLYDKVTGNSVNTSAIALEACSMRMLGTQPGGLPAAPPAEEPEPEPIRYVYQAEDAVYSGGNIDTTTWPYCNGTGIYNYPSGSGSYVEFTVNVPSPGPYELIFRYALASGDRPLKLTVNGEDIVASSSFPVTGNWRSFDIMSFPDIELNAGENTIRLTSVGNDGPNLDQLEVVDPDGPRFILFNDSFDGGDTSRWTEGTNALWSAILDSGDYAYNCAFDWYMTPLNLSSMPEAVDYQIDMDVKFDRMEGWSYTFIYGRFADVDNHYVLTLEKTSPDTRIRLTKRQGGASTVLATSYLPIALDEWHHVAFSMAGDELGCLFDDVTVLTVQDNNPLGRGGLAIATQKQGVTFDNIYAIGPEIKQTLYEAELYSAQNGCSLDTAHSGYSGNGYMDFGGNGTYVEWDNVDVGEGERALFIRYANGSTSNRICNVLVNGVVTSSLDFVPTGGWSTWLVASIPNVTLNEGQNALKIIATTSSGGPNIDLLEIL